MTAEQQKLIPARDENLKNGNYTVLNGEYTKNFNVYVVGENHKEAIDYIMVALDRSTDNVLGFGINEVYIMTAHWAFVIPLAIAFLVKAAGHTPHALKLRILLTALTLWLWGYNGILLGGYLLN